MVGFERGVRDADTRCVLVGEQYGGRANGAIPGALYRGVLVKGIIALTNRRLFIFAVRFPTCEEELGLTRALSPVHPAAGA